MHYQYRKPQIRPFIKPSRNGVNSTPPTKPYARVLIPLRSLLKSSQKGLVLELAQFLLVRLPGIYDDDAPSAAAATAVVGCSFRGQPGFFVAGS